MAANSTEKRTSRYVQGGETDRYQKRLGWWERRTLEQRDDDIVLEISVDQHQRPDLVAYAVYGQRDLQWLVLQYNNILDIITEFTKGKEIRLPAPSRLSQEIMTQATGGKLV